MPAAFASFCEYLQSYDIVVYTLFAEALLLLIPLEHTHK